MVVLRLADIYLIDFWNSMFLFAQFFSPIVSVGRFISFLAIWGEKGGGGFVLYSINSSLPVE